MRILVDTSAWADFLNGFPSLEGAALAELIASEHDLCTCGLVVAEVFQGLRREKERGQIGALFTHLTFLEPSGIGVYFRAADLYRSLRQKGRTVRSTVDCLIAAIAEEHECRVLARDRDLELILESGLVTTRLWLPSSR